MPQFTPSGYTQPQEEEVMLGKVWWLDHLPVFCAVFTVPFSRGEGESADEARLPRGIGERAGSATC